MKIFEIYGNPTLTRWDVCRQLIVQEECSHVHFATENMDVAMVCRVETIDGMRIVRIPDEMLHSSGRLVVYAYVVGQECYTKRVQEFFVKDRPKPADYVYTPAEVKTWENLNERIEALEESGGAAGSYYTPVVEQTAEDTVQMRFSPSREEMPAVEAQSITLPAGPAGRDGETPVISVSKNGSLAKVTISLGGNENVFYVEDGAAGYTPVKGVDYFTEADKAAMVAMVIESLGGNPIFGYVDENNNIVVQGNLPDGTYSVRYEMVDGSTVKIGDLVLDTAVPVYHSVTNNLTNCVSSNREAYAGDGQAYSATISANSGYELSSVVVTMGGVDISSSAVSGGNIAIANVTGNIVITAVATEIVVAPVNLLPSAVDASGNQYVGTNGEDGYKYGYRISRSSGNETAASDEDVYCTGFMPVTLNDTIRITGIVKTNNDSTSNIVYYNSSKTYVGGVTLFGSNSDVDADGTGITTQPSRSQTSSAIAFFRFSAGSITDDTIVAVS